MPTFTEGRFPGRDKKTAAAPVKKAAAKKAAAKKADDE